MKRLSHYVKPNESSKQPRCFVYLDTEARSEVTNRGQVQTWRCAVTAHDCRDHHKNQPREREWQEHETPEGLWEWITKRAIKGRRCVLVAHNLGYDLRISQAFTILPKLGWDCDQIRLDRGQAFARFRNAGRTITMVDSISWVGASLWQLGEIIGRPKPALPYEDDPDWRWLERCRQDVEILAEVWQILMRWIEEGDLGNWHPTGAGQAWAAWRHRFYNERVLVHGDPEATEAERASVYAGRTEAWKHGALPSGPWWEFDYASAYAQICADIDLPTKLCFKVARFKPGVYERAVAHRRVLAWCDVETTAPILPYRDAQGIVWPTGSFTGWYWDNEVALAKSAGATVHPRYGYVYKARPALRDFAEWLLAFQNPANALRGPIERLAAKHWGRAIVGRFGASYAQWEHWGEALGGRVGLCRLVDMETGVRTKVMHLGTTAMIQGDIEDGPDAFPAIMAYVMAEGRCRLWRAMVAAGPENTAHVDTDGLVVNDAGRARLEAAAIEGLRLKGGYETLTVLGPRQIIGDRLVKASGVPRGSYETSPGIVTGEVWRSLTASLNAGETDRVIVRRRQWKLRGRDLRRHHLPDHATSALRVTRGERHSL